ncbi:MAG: hypothetical protein ACC641_02715 [Acidiferrobacterales bacterium]
MDEQQYRETYRQVNELPCVFERAILRRCGTCEDAQRLNLAEREAVKCLSESSHHDCREFLDIVHEKSAFAIGLPIPGEKLPFGKEIKIQCGSIAGLKNVLDEDAEDPGIHALIRTATISCGDITSLPFEYIVREVSAFKSRRGKT